MTRFTRCSEVAALAFKLEDLRTKQRSKFDGWARRYDMIKS